MALQSGTAETVMQRHQSPSPTDGLGIRHTHKDMVQRRGKEGVLMFERMGRKATDGAARKAPKSGTEEYSTAPTTSKSSGWAGEQAYPRGDGSTSREGG
mmetsp:Transcript_24328/g.43583  ORF Transcript_24328/g.43583 Transcript_24328/m.43583 type:complete len:99 (+) Transcript_24328:308-604(+)